MASKFIITAAHCLYTDHCIRDKSMKCVLRKPEQIEVYHVYMLTSTSVHVYKYMCTSTCVQVHVYNVHVYKCSYTHMMYILSIVRSRLETMSSV